MNSPCLDGMIKQIQGETIGAVNAMELGAKEVESGAQSANNHRVPASRAESEGDYSKYGLR